MREDRRSLIVPLVMIALGAGWLLTSLGVAGEIDWVWTIGLAVAGVIPFVLSGVDKFSVVVGPFLMIASLLSVLRQTDRLSIDHELPILLMVAGVLILLARRRGIPVPGWFYEGSGGGDDRERS